MLLYWNGSWGRKLLQIYGSAVYKLDVCGVGLLVAVATAGLQYMQNEYIDLAMPHQYALQVLGGIVTIELGFRTNQAWKRYWDGIHQLHFMYSKWADAYSQFCGFVGVTIQKTKEKGEDGVESKVAWLQDMQGKVENDFLLLSAMACDRLCRGDCARMQRRHELKVAWKKRVVMREELRKGTDLTNAKGMPKFRIPKFRESDVSCKSVDIEDLDMQGGWQAEYMLHKPPDGKKYDLLAGSADRANMVVNWLNHNLAYCSAELMAPPPIQSRMYQEISNGMVGFNSAVKISDVPFPFPHSQVMLMLLMLFLICLPVYIMSFTESMIAGPTLAFLITTFLISMNDIARELENPYGQGSNQICVPEFHSRFLLVVRDASISSKSPPLPPKQRKVSEIVRNSTQFELAPRENESIENTEHTPVSPKLTERDSKLQELPSPKEGSKLLQEVPCPKEDSKLLQEVLSLKEGMDQDKLRQDVVTKSQDMVTNARLYSQIGMGNSEMELILQQLARTHALMEQHLSILSQQLRCLSNNASNPSVILDSEMITPIFRPHSYAIQSEAYAPRTDHQPVRQTGHQKYTKTRLPDAGPQERSSHTISALNLSSIVESCKGSCADVSRTNAREAMVSL